MVSRIAAMVVLLIAGLHPVALRAEPVPVEQAQNAVKGWLKTNYRPLGAILGRQIARAETFTGQTGEAIYHVVYLQPNGYVIVPADDAVEPILCFVETGTYDPSDDRPLGALVGRDVPARIAAVRGLEAAKAGVLPQSTTGEDEKALEEAIGNAQAKRDRLTAASTGVTIMGLPGVADMRVGPLLQSTWGQTTVGDYIGGISCYNYYTPPYAAGNSDNYPIGCVAAAMAQLMRYHQHPAGYAWGNMPLQPDSAITLAQRQAIGWLCYEAAESVDTVYGPGGSTASLDDAYLSLRNTFGYGNSVIARNPTVGTTLNNMVNTNLDGALPVLLGLDSAGGGHAVVCDGYGYNSSTLYHHLNMGWSGHDNAWYALPVVDTSSYDFYAVHACVYNIFTTGAGEIISGRVTDPSGNAITGATVVAQRVGGGTYNATTDIEGIYALVKVPSASSYTVTVTKIGYDFTNQDVTTGTSIDTESISGNHSGIDFQADQLPSKATNPSPSNGATNQSINVDISWSNGGGATNYDVYFGTNPTPDGGEHKDNQSGTSYDPGTLAYSTTYYWCIDANNTSGITPGDVWSFTTEPPPLPDFNGDGTTDLLWKRASTGSNYATLMNGLTKGPYGYLGGNSDGLSIIGVGDFNGDGKTDILWKRALTGSNYVTLMNGLTRGPFIYLAGNGDGLIIIGVGDFNGDGKTDILWKRASTGSNYVTLMNGTTKGPFAYLGGNGDGLSIVGVGDFDGGGKTDILWKRASTGSNYVTLMNGTTKGPFRYLAGNGDGLSITGVGNFDGGGKTDILWKRALTGSNYVTLMNSTAKGPFVYLAGNGDGLSIIGVGDFDGGGKMDILWKRALTGSNYATLMNGTAKGPFVYLAGNGDGLSIIGVGDFNGDGKTDLLWKRVSTGSNYATLMDGLTKGPFGYLAGNGDGLTITAPQLLHGGLWVK